MKKKDLENLKGELLYMESLIDSLDNSDRYGEYSTKEQDTIKETIQKILDKKDAVINKINKLDDPLQRKVLYDKYIIYLSHNDIALSIGYSYNHISKILKRALTEFERA